MFFYWRSLEDRMKKLNITVDDICRPIVEELKELDSVGTDVKVFLKNGSSHIMNIRTVLASLVGDNLGVYEMLGYTKTFGLGFICRICGSNHERIQTDIEFQSLGCNADENEYSNVLQSIEICVRNRKMKELIQGKPLSKSELRKKNNKDCVQRNRFGFENSCEFFKVYYSKFNIKVELYIFIL